MHIETLLAHTSEFGGISDIYGASHFPIYQTATFDLKKQTGEIQYDYTRSGNPTREALENIFAKAENAAYCVCTHTGLGAVALLFEVCLKTGSKILVESDCYGGTFRLLKFFKEKYDIEIFFADFNKLISIEEILNNNKIDLILCESPTNPGMKIIDLSAIGKLAKKFLV